MDFNFNLIYALVGFLIMLGLLGGIGINKPRGMSVKMWCVGYLVVAIVFDILVVIALLWHFEWLNNLLIGLAAGAATGLGLHVMHHINEEGEHEHGIMAYNSCSQSTSSTVNRELSLISFSIFGLFAFVSKFQDIFFIHQSGHLEVVHDKGHILEWLFSLLQGD